MNTFKPVRAYKRMKTLNPGIALCHIAGAAAILLAHAPAFAAASSSATISNFTITLTDLDPTDGIAPSITFAGLSTAFSYAKDTFAGLTPSQGNMGGAAFSAVSSSTATPVSNGTGSATGSSPSVPINATTSLTGTLFSGGSTIGTSSAVPGNNLQGAYYGQSGWNYDGTTAFTISAKTAVTFTATGTATAAVTTPFTLTPNNPEHAYAYAYMYGSGPSITSSSGQFRADVSNFGGPMSASRTGEMSVSFENLTSSDVSNRFYAYTQADGYSSVVAVPEPKTYVLLLAGLSAVGFTVRRRLRA